MKSVNDTFRSRENGNAESRATGCRHTRQWFLARLSRGLGPEAGWVQRHIAACPRCCRRAASWRRVDLAVRIVKSRPQPPGLLGKANREAVRMLGRELQEATQARALTRSETEPPFPVRVRRCRHRLTNLAACLAILCLSKSGLFTSLNRINTGGEALVRHYYASQVGEDLAGEVFDG